MKHKLWLFPTLLALLLAAVCSLPRLFSHDYTQVVNANWHIGLPHSQGSVYETDSGPSFTGDGWRYHVLAYPAGSLDNALGWRTTVPEEAMGDIRDILDRLEVPEEERPDLDVCRYFGATDPGDPRDSLYLLLSPLSTRLYVVEDFW